MILSAKFVRVQLRLLKPFLTGGGIEAERKRQETIGSLMSRTRRDETTYSISSFGRFSVELITPKAVAHDGVILYLHGGGYVGGDVEYARGFGTVLASEYRIKVLCAAYRLAPEHPFPAALEDTLEAYQFLLRSGYSARQIVLCGESAGGGLIFALCLKLKALNIDLPCGLVSISPWSDLTCSGRSYEENKHADPYMTKEQLQFYAECYAGDLRNPLVSPLFGDLSGMPKSLIFAGGDEIMLSDAAELHRKLRESNCESELVVALGMWHAYILYQVKETRKDYGKIREFLHGALGQRP